MVFYRSKLNMNKKAFLAVAVTLFIPFISYMLVKYTSERDTAIPHHYLPDSVVTRIDKGKMITDTIWHRVANISGINQLGDTVNLYNVQGRAIVMDFFFTSCGSICPQLTQNMARMQQSFLKGGDTYSTPDSSIVQFISFSVDPTRDSVTRLKAYADRFKADPSNWWFLTGNRDAIYDFAFSQLKVDQFNTEPINPDFVHTNRFVLLDRNYYVRGYYNGLDSASLIKLSKDIGILMLEKDPNNDPLPFDPVQMLVFFVIAVFLTIIGVSLIFKKRKNG